jgi:uncharacterized membrane protein YheB (UPF0754 family)
MLPFWLKYIVYPFLGAFIGFLTNWIAITLLFRPKKKIFGIQGVLEKRKPELAKKTAEVISEYLLNTQEIKKIVDKEKVETSIVKLVDKTLSSMPRFAKNLLSKTLQDITYKYFFDKSGYIKEEILELALNDSELENIITEKIMNYEIGQIEYIIKKASGPEINFILASGAVLGFIVGLLETLLPF